MQKSILSLCLCFSTVLSSCQPAKQTTEFNFGFEKIAPNAKLPEDWFKWGNGYSLKTDTIIRHSGKASVLIEPMGEKAANAFGCVAYGIPARYKGKEIELKAYMKYSQVADGAIGLLLRIDGATGSLAFDNMQKQNIQGTADWKEFSIKLPYPEGAKMIYIGALLNGTGQLWVDDFQVFLDGKELQKVKLIEVEEYKADKDEAYNKGSGISSIELTESGMEDLAKLGKVWGFLKYYHPAIAKGEYNWDYELFRILPGILAAKDAAERSLIMEDWVRRLGKVEIAKHKEKIEGEVKLSTDLSWIDELNWGDKFIGQLKVIRDAKRLSTHYYIGLADGVGNPVFQNERPYNTMKYPDAGFRLLSLYRYWNIIEYYFPYRNLITEDWDGVLKEFIPKFVTASNELEYKLSVLSLIARVSDTHANIWGQDSTLQSFRGIHYAPLEIKFVGNAAIVADYIDDALGEASGLKVGDIIETINQTPVEDIIKTKLPFTPASNYPTQLRDIARDLLRTNDTILELGYRRGDQPFSLQIKCYDTHQMNPYKRYMEKDTCFKIIDDDIAYLYPGAVKNEYLPEIMPEIMDKKGLIIDFRCYPSDFIVFSLSEYLQPKETNFVRFSNGSIITPGQFAMTDALAVGKQNKDYYKGKVVIIVNEVTQSSAEYHTMALRTAPDAMVIGSTTAGADGNVSQFYLPGGIYTMISGIGVYYPDGTETQRIGIVPDIEVKPTIKGITEGRDEVLEKAIEIINKQ